MNGRRMSESQDRKMEREKITKMKLEKKKMPRRKKNDHSNCKI